MKTSVVREVSEWTFRGSTASISGQLTVES